jgi:hypothetical protein
MKKNMYTSVLASSLFALVLFTASAPAGARAPVLVTWGVQCFLGSKIGECNAGKPIRFEVRANSPDHARKIANTAGQRKKKWNRCFRVSRQVNSLPTCNPKSGVVTK